MSNLERVTITLTSEMNGMIQHAIEDGRYASTSELVREALRTWEIRDKVMQAELEALRAEIKLGMDDVEAGRVVDFDPEDIIKRGRARRLAKRLN